MKLIESRFASLKTIEGKTFNLRFRKEKHPNCVYCSDKVTLETSEVVLECESCGVIFHDSCWMEFNSTHICPTPGCNPEINYSYNYGSTASEPSSWRENVYLLIFSIVLVGAPFGFVYGLRYLLGAI